MTIEDKFLQMPSNQFSRSHFCIHYLQFFVIGKLLIKQAINLTERQSQWILYVRATEILSGPLFFKSVFRENDSTAKPYWVIQIQKLVKCLFSI
jgi:hypothetical protein